MTRFLQAYLMSYSYWLLVSLGCLGLSMMRNCTGGRWAQAIEPPMAAGIRTLPAMTLLFLPIALGMQRLYPWLPSAHRFFYLNGPFFIARAVLYFAIWLALAWRALPSADGAPKAPAGPGLLLWSFAVTFAFVDWVMSVDLKAHSTIFGLIVIAGAGLSAYAACAAVICWPLRGRDLAPAEREVLGDLGNLMLAFIMLWAYTEYSQWVIIWSGDQPSEISWYLSRAKHGWEIPGLLVIFFGFFAPFFALLFRELKRRARVLGSLAAAILAVRWLDLYWTVMPSFSPERPRPDWRDLAAFVGIGAVWAFFFRRGLAGRIPAAERRA